MEKKKKYKWNLAIIIFVTLIFLIVLIFTKNNIPKIEKNIQLLSQEKLPITETAQKIEYRQGIFSWIPATINSKNRKDLNEIISQLGINEVYQYFDKINVKNADAFAFSNELNNMDIDLYLLAGASNWTYKPDGKPMLDEIARAVAFRNYWGEDTLKGIVFDIEPYDSEKWIKGKQEILMENYIDGMKIAYEKAKSEGLRIILCIPYWYDVEYNDTLIKLLDYCDEISVMNYGRTNEYKNIANEIEYAKTYTKDVTCIFEFQAVGEYNLTEDQTYHNLGIEIAKSNFEKLYLKADYLGLKFAYHYLEPIQEMLLK